MIESLDHISPLEFDWIIVHKEFGRTHNVEPLRCIRENFIAGYGNEVLVLLSRLPAVTAGAAGLSRMLGNVARRVVSMSGPRRLADGENMSSHSGT